MKLIKYSAFYTVGFILLGIVITILDLLGIENFSTSSTLTQTIVGLVSMVAMVPILLFWLSMLRNAIHEKKWLWSFWLLLGTFFAGLFYYFNVYKQHKNT